MANNRSPIAFLALGILVASAILAESSAELGALQTGAPSWFTVEGLVERSLNLTYAELEHFPQVSEVTTLQCVGGGQGGPKVTYNWTGVPLFYILSMARVRPGSYREVVFNATDGFSSSVTLQTAMEPTTLLGLKANGTDLELVSGLANGHRVVLPCRWGYKWVKWIRQIIVVDYDYKGTYESSGNSDEALRPNCTMPATSPQTGNFTVSAPENHVVRAISNSTIQSFSLGQDKRLVFNVRTELDANGYMYLILPAQLLENPRQVSVDQTAVESFQIEYEGSAYILLTYPSGDHTIVVEGTPSTSNHGAGARTERRLLV